MICLLWLFVVSPGGRTGATTVLGMVNAHPAFGLAGETGGQLETAMQLYKTAANQQGGSHGDAWGRGDVHPYDLLCDPAGWFEHVTPPAHAAAQISRSVGPSSGSSGSERARTVRGFKEIRWGKTDAAPRFGSSTLSFRAIDSSSVKGLGIGTVCLTMETHPRQIAKLVRGGADTEIDRA